jgi:magnesium transporter
MIKSFVFQDGKIVGQDIDPEALKLVRADKGLHIWVNLFLPTPEESKLILEEVFNFHPLAVEDCLSVSQFPKIEDYEDYLFMVMHAVDFNRQEQFTTSELDFFLGKEFLVTHHTVPFRTIDMMAERLQKNVGVMPKAMDRLMHLLLNAMVDNYQPVLRELTGEIEELEESIFSDGSGGAVMKEFLKVKKELGHLRSIVKPQIEVMSRIASGEFKIIRSHLLPYFRDVYSNLRQIDEAAVSYNDRLLLSLDVFLNKASNQTNDIIKVLTLLTALTTPLMIVGTWYGMNFEHMPELSQPYAYEWVIAGTVVSTVALMAYLKWKKYI